MPDNKPLVMTLIPPNTHIFEPDGIHQVTLQFPTENDAIVFYEYLKELCNARQ